MKKIISILIVIATLISFAACGKEITIGKYDESQLSNGEWISAEYLGYSVDIANATITAKVKLGWQEFFFYCDSEPTLEVGDTIELYFTANEEILAVR